MFLCKKCRAAIGRIPINPVASTHRVIYDQCVGCKSVLGWLYAGKNTQKAIGAEREEKRRHERDNNIDRIDVGGSSSSHRNMARGYYSHFGADIEPPPPDQVVVVSDTSQLPQQLSASPSAAKAGQTTQKAIRGERQHQHDDKNSIHVGGSSSTGSCSNVACGNNKLFGSNIEPPPEVVDLSDTSLPPPLSASPPAEKMNFTKVEKLRPFDDGVNLIVKVLRSEMIVSRSRLAECVVGDDTGVILLTARDEQVDVMRVGVIVILYKAKIESFEQTMRLVVDQGGRIEVTEPDTFNVKILPCGLMQLDDLNIDSS